MNILHQLILMLTICNNRANDMLKNCLQNRTVSTKQKYLKKTCVQYFFLINKTINFILKIKIFQRLCQHHRIKNNQS
jgi:hypothetical protein